MTGYSNDLQVLPKTPERSLEPEIDNSNKAFLRSNLISRIADFGGNFFPQFGGIYPIFFSFGVRPYNAVGSMTIFLWKQLRSG